MRTNAVSGLGLFALCALVACSTETVIRQTDAPTDPASQDGTDDGTTDDGTDPGQTSDTDPETPSGPLVKGVTLKDIAVYQGVKVLVVSGGKWVSSRNAPVVAGRVALVRVFVSTDSSYDGSTVTAELRLTTGGKKLPILKDTKKVSTASTDADTKTTFNFEVPADQLDRDTSFSVALTSPNGDDPTSTSASPARFPQDGTTKSLAAEASGKVKVVLVPVKYMADGSGRQPDVTQTQLDLYKQTMMSMYPATSVEITVHAPYQYTNGIAANGSGWSSVLQSITNLRQADRAPSDVYYYGAFAPTSSFNTYCGGGCVTGLSTVVDTASTSYLRASVGIGFSGIDAAKTMAHEVGHAHGREHAPCGGADSPDENFPYTGGTIGVWGYDIFAKTLLSPTKGHDVMGYCENSWVSDYTYSALFDRISALNPTTTKSQQTGGNALRTYRVATVAADGALSYENEVELADLTGGTEVPSVQGARFYKFDHLPGGVLMLPKSAITTSITRIDMNAR